MQRRLTDRIFSAVAIVAFAGANGLTASGLHALSHQAEAAVTVSEAVSHAGHGAADHGTSDEGHDHGSPDECSCFGTCASVTPPLAPSSGTSLGDGPDAESSARLAWDPRSPSPRPTEYLFPLPNAPPVRA